MSEPTLVIEGEVQTWGVAEFSRRYLQGVLPYRVARQVFQPELYDAAKGRGEQRPEIKAHTRAIARDILAGQFTPTTISAGVRKSQAKTVEYKSGRARLSVDPASPLPLTDGQQRFGALRSILETAVKAENAELVSQVESLPIPFVLHLDGDTQRDFIALQLGRSIDAAHLLSLKAQQKMLPAKDQDVVLLAQEIAKALNADIASPFFKSVRLDARGCGPLPVTTLCARTAGDLAVSLVGLAKVGTAMGVREPKALAGYVVAAYKAVSQAPGLIGQGYPLCPPPDGTKGGATLLIGLAVCLAYRLKADDRTEPDADDLDRLLESALAVFMTPLNGSLSSSDKRNLIKQFAVEFLGACGPFHHEVPEELQRILSASAFANRPLPRAPNAAEAVVQQGSVPSEDEDDGPPIDFGADETAEAESAGSYA